jgi:DNA replication licensing factor MCM5
MNIHMNRTNEVTEAVGDIPIDKMKRYISYCRAKCAPRLSPEASERLSSHFVEIRKRVHTKEANSNERSSIPITVRQLEALIRITESLAKLELSPVATEIHVNEAIRLFYASTMNAVEQEGLDRNLADDVRNLEGEILKQLPIGWSTSYRKLVNVYVNSGRFQKHTLDKALMILERRESIQFRHQRSNIYRSSV